MLIALFIAAQPPAQPALTAGPKIGFVAAPTEAQYQAAYPTKARDAKQEGRVSMRCKVETTGALANCAVTEETPAGFEFGDQSLKLAPLFRLGPGPFPENGRTTVPLNWSVSGSSPAASPPVPPVQGPNWIRKPTGRDYAELYPERAVRTSKDGRVKLRCTVTAAGLLTGCAVVEEIPAGYGFGDASIKAAERFAMSLTLPDGRSTAGATVTIPLDWVLHSPTTPP
jgi:TonB family protein